MPAFTHGAGGLDQLMNNKQEFRDVALGIGFRAPPGWFLLSLSDQTSSPQDNGSDLYLRPGETPEHGELRYLFTSGLTEADNITVIATVEVSLYRPGVPLDESMARDGGEIERANLCGVPMKRKVQDLGDGAHQFYWFEAAAGLWLYLHFSFFGANGKARLAQAMQHLRLNESETHT